MAPEAVVVGAGPNGLAAAVRLAQAGRSVLVVERNPNVGGGTRTELIGGDARVDVCSAVHPLGAASPFFRSLPLAEHGLEWVNPPVLAAHPIDRQPAALLHADAAATADGLVAADGRRWRRLLAPVVDHWDDLAESVLGPVTRLPRHPITLARFGLRAMRSSTATTARFESPEAAALFAGMAAHTMLPLDRPFTTAVGLMLAGAADVGGWPFALGGSQAIADALTAHLVSLGGVVHTDRSVETLDELPAGTPVLFDTAPEHMARIAGHELPSRYRRRLRAYRRGMSSFKVDYVLREPVPWSDPRCGEAGTVHLGGTAEEVAAAEATTWAGRVPERPFTLVAQPSIVDPSRAPAGRHVLWAYCHAPPGFRGDLTDVVTGHIEHYAPGFRDVIELRVSRDAAAAEADNPNLVGGDIGGGSPAGRQIILRPIMKWDPYRTPNPRLFICSASTPPGAGVHGMCGFRAAESLLAHWPD